MAIVLTGTKTVTKDPSPTTNGAALTTLFALAVEQLTPAQLFRIARAINHITNDEDTRTLAQIFL